MKILILLFLGIVLFGCGTSKKKHPVLLADREAPLGWVYLKMYDDNSFEFILTGLRDEDVYPGTYTLKRDTIFFQYRDSIPKAGKTAILSKGYVSYIEGTYHESVQIQFTQLFK